MSTTDLRDALNDLATEAPTLDLADRAIARSRARRRSANGASAAVVAVILAVPLVATTIGADDQARTPPSSGGSETGQVEPDITGPRWPWSNDTLPARLDEPIAMVITSAFHDAGAVTASGRWWSLGSTAVAPVVSADGQAIAWWDSDDQSLVLRALDLGTDVQVPAGQATDFDGVVIDPTVPMRWSPNGGKLAVTGTGGELAVVDATTGEATEITTLQGVIAGWRDDDRLVVLGSYGTGVGPVVNQVTLDGAVTALGVLGLPAGSDEVTAAMSPDGQLLAWFDYEVGSGTIAHFWHLDHGPSGDVSCDCVPGSYPVWTMDASLLVESRNPGPTVYGTLDQETTAFDPMIAVSPRIASPAITLATDLSRAGASGEPHTSRWWFGWNVDWLTYAVLALLLAGGTVILLIARRRRSRAGL